MSVGALVAVDGRGRGSVRVEVDVIDGRQQKYSVRRNKDGIEDSNEDSTGDTTENTIQAIWHTLLLRVS